MNATRISAGLSLRLSVTDRCQLRCRYCMPPEGFARCAREELLGDDELLALVSDLRAAFGLAKIRITGGEPLMRPRLENLVERLAALNPPDFALTTNGLRLAESAAALRRAGLRRVNISLDALDPAVFERVTGGRDVRAVLRGIDAALAAGLTPVKLNTVVARGLNEDQIENLVVFALERGCELRFIELMPIGPGAALHAGGFVSSAELRARIAARFDLIPLGREAGASAERYCVTDPDGRVGTLGFISPCSAPFCADCNRLRVTADGRFLGCLAWEGGLSVREPLRRGDFPAIIQAARDVLRCKRDNADFTRHANMASVGG